ncbi:hypothetical protein PINS_up009044 [Pythium insidiosum]|nr:hypothetical protein PINS_up009044 [Pythium insidiosum]
MASSPDDLDRAVKMNFATTPQDNDPLGHLWRVLFATVSDENNASIDVAVPPSPIVGYTRLFAFSDHVLATAIVASEAIPEASRLAVERALFEASTEVGQAFAREIIRVRNASIPVDAQAATPTVQMMRSIVNASETVLQLYKDAEFDAESTGRLEMTRFLDKDRDESPLLEAPSGIVVRSLDLVNDDLVRVFDSLKIAFGPSPPCFQAWKQHFALQPRFAPELSFVAWEGETPVSVVAVERMVDGEGGGDDELPKIYSTHAELLKRGEDADLDQTLVYESDFAERKAKIEASATTAYVCGVATADTHRRKGLAQLLLRHCFRAGADAGLDAIFLGTDTLNNGAVRTYERAGMVKTKFTPGRLMSKPITLEP